MIIPNFGGFNEIIYIYIYGYSNITDVLKQFVRNIYIYMAPEKCLINIGFFIRRIAP